MNRNLCYHCGGELGERSGRIVCLHCGSYVPEHISSEEVMLLTSACQKLRLADFFDAEQEFDDIIRRHPTNAQGYWGRLLAKYGIKYEEDYDGSRIPTCYAASMESVYDSLDYKKAMEYADEESRAVFREHAAYIERVRKEWVEKASKESSYDIFISYKDSDRERGIKRTQDSFVMQDLYFQLKERGYRVFFSHESLRNKTGEKYEPYIYGALSTAKVMLVYGSKPEYIEATWVKNEWTRYIRRMKNGEKKPDSLIVAYEGFAPSALPSALSSLQCLDAGEKRFYTDLFAAIERILDGESTEKAVKTDGTEVDLCKHVPMLIPGKEPTCTTPGYTESSLCTLCGKTLKSPEALPATGHSFGEWHISKKATCTEDGLHERVCHCGAKETKTIPSRGGHVPGEWKTVREPAPGKEGLRARICILCGSHAEEETIPALPSPQVKKSPSHLKKESKGLEYEVNEDGKTCTVTGQGTCKDKDVVIPEVIDGYRVTEIEGNSGFNKDITSVVIPDSVKSIDRYAFKYCSSLERIVIPDSVMSIGNEAFSDCTSLASVEIPSSVTTIGSGVFYNCETLASVEIPSSVTSIGNWAFQACKSLSCVKIPDSVTNIGFEAFTGCGEVMVSEDNPNYRSIDGNLYTKDGKTLLHYAANKKELSFSIPGLVTNIGAGAFSDCSRLVRVEIPDSVTSIGSRAFFLCSRLIRVKIPGSVTSVGDRAFMSCNRLRSFVIPDSVTSIGDDAFSGCESFSSVNIPASVTSVGKGAFSGCGEVTVSEDNPNYRSIDGNLYTKDGKTLLYYAANKEETSFLIPKAVTSIGDSAFSLCTSLVSIKIPNSVKSIGRSAFAGCESLSSVNIPGSVTSIDNNAFFYCTSLVSIKIPNSVKSIGGGAFRGCKSLASVKIPSSVKRIGNYAFSGCQSLKTLHYAGTKGHWEVISLGMDWKSDSSIQTVKCKFGTIDLQD